MGVVYTKVIFLVGACSHKSVNNHLLCVYLCVCSVVMRGRGGGKCSHLLYTCVCVWREVGEYQQPHVVCLCVGGSPKAVCCVCMCVHECVCVCVCVCAYLNVYVCVCVS